MRTPSSCFYSGMVVYLFPILSFLTSACRPLSSRWVVILYLIKWEAPCNAHAENWPYVRRDCIKAGGAFCDMPILLLSLLPPGAICSVSDRYQSLLATPGCTSFCLAQMVSGFPSCASALRSARCLQHLILLSAYRSRCSYVIFIRISANTPSLSLVLLRVSKFLEAHAKSYRYF